MLASAAMTYATGGYHVVLHGIVGPVVPGPAAAPRQR